MKLSQMLAALKLCPMVTLLMVALLTVIYAAAPVLTADNQPPAYNCCTTMNNQCIKSNLCSVLNCVCGSDVEDSLMVDAKPPANNCCTMNNQCVKSELCKELDCVCSSAADDGTIKVKDGKTAFMSPRDIQEPAAEKPGMVKKGMRATQH